MQKQTKMSLKSRKFSMFMAITIACFLFAACRSTIYQINEVRTFEPRQGVIITPLIADYEVLSITPVVDSMVFDMAIYSSLASIDDFKNEVMSTILKKHNADAIIAALTSVERIAESHTKVVVRGYPVRYKNFRSATANDSWIIPFFNVIDRNTDGNPDNNSIILTK